MKMNNRNWRDARAVFFFIQELALMSVNLSKKLAFRNTHKIKVSW